MSSRKKRRARSVPRLTPDAAAELTPPASATGQTGLIPAAPGSPAAAEAYEALWPPAGQRTTEEE